jgi:hypothetical protein
MKIGRILPALILVLGIWAWQEWPTGTRQAGPDASPVASSFEAQTPGADGATPFRSGERVETSGVVERVLADDNDGSRHQRFIVRLASGQTLLIAHNIDIAPRVAGLDRGDTVSFAGIYEPNDKGGVVHWTHHDPSGRRTGGWIEHNAQRYQ